MQVKTGYAASFISILSLVLLQGCAKKENKYTFWETSKFNLKPSALADSQEVKLIYCSHGPDVFKDFENQVGVYTSPTGDVAPFLITDYYVHYVVVDTKTNDTLNVLTPEAKQVSQSDRDVVFLYTKEPDQYKKILFNKELTENPKKGTKFNVNDIEIPRHDRVARDKNFDHVADNSFATVIGFLQRRK